ncbi:MAG TPA: 4-hydroxyacetophenone monooxygenase, partial [Actinomycetota bacterium]|nr:4-hydroxyacetophenone monooxygenase [Actinomycetota bacterium]
QATYLADMLRHARAVGRDVIEVRPEVQSAFNAEIQGRMAPTVWLAGGCASWYLDERGKNTTLWPDFTWRFKRRTAAFDPHSYRLRAGRPLTEQPERVGGAA